MTQHRVLETEDLLVAAALAHQHGFFQTEKALYDMARCTANAASTICPTEQRQTTNTGD